MTCKKRNKNSKINIFLQLLSYFDFWLLADTYTKIESGKFSKKEEFFGFLHFDVSICRYGWCDDGAKTNLLLFNSTSQEAFLSHTTCFTIKHKALPLALVLFKIFILFYLYNNTHYRMRIELTLIFSIPESLLIN